MMSSNQLAAYGLSEDFAQHNLVIRSGNRGTASPATDDNDVIDSRILFDVFAGGGGGDIFIYGPESSQTTIITDFNPEDGDKIHLAGLDADLNQPGHQSFTFSGQTRAAHSVWYNCVEYTGSHRMRVMADRDGQEGVLEFMVILPGVASFQESDLVL